MLQQILTLAAVFTVIDCMYLFSVSGRFQRMIFEVQGGRSMEFNLAATFLCYIALVFVLWWFILRTGKSPWEAALLGWAIYAVYETTNKATLKDWYWSFVVLDTVWGGVLFATTTWVMQTFLL